MPRKFGLLVVPLSAALTPITSETARTTPPAWLKELVIVGEPANPVGTLMAPSVIVVASNVPEDIANVPVWPVDAST